MGQVVAICTVVTKIVAAVQAIHQVVNAVQEWRAKNKAASEKEVKDKVNEGMMQHKDLSNLNDAQNKALQGVKDALSTKLFKNGESLNMAKQDVEAMATNLKSAWGLEPNEVSDLPGSMLSFFNSPLTNSLPTSTNDESTQTSKTTTKKAQKIAH